jgi:hypothetical protein
MDGLVAPKDKIQGGKSYVEYPEEKLSVNL